MLLQRTYVMFLSRIVVLHITAVTALLIEVQWHKDRLLLDDFGHNASTNRLASFSQGKSQTVSHGYGVYQLNRECCVISWHDLSSVIIIIVIIIMIIIVVIAIVK